MEWITKYSIGAALAVAIALPRGASAQTRSTWLASGVGTANAQRVGEATTSRAGVYVAPTAGVDEVAASTESYEYSEWKPSTTEAVGEADYAPDLEALEKAYNANQERARRRHTTRPLNVPTTLGMLKDKPTNANPAAPLARVPAASAPTPRYLQYAPNAAPTAPSSSRSAYPLVESTETQDAPRLNWDGTTNREVKQFGRVQAPTTPTSAPAIFEPATATRDQDESLATESVYEAEPLDETASVGVASFPEGVEASATEAEPEVEVEPTPAGNSAFAADVLEELRGEGTALDVAEPEETAPAVETALPVFAQPETDAETASPAQDAANPLEIPDFNDPETPEETAPVAEDGAAPQEDASDAPAPESTPVEPVASEEEPTAPATESAPDESQAAASSEESASSVAVASPNKSAPPVYGPIYQSSYPAAGRANQAAYLSVAPYVGGSNPTLPQTRGVPGHFHGALPKSAGIPQYSASGRVATYEPLASGYGAGLEFGAPSEGTRPGLILGAEWFYWTTDADVSYATVNDATGAIFGRDLEVENSGLRGRIGFRTVSGWDLIGTFTWFNESDEGALRSGDLSDDSTFSNVRLGDDLSLDSVDSRLKTDMQTIDIEMGRWTKVGRYDFRVFGGVRWTGLNQEVADQGAYSYSYPVSSSENLLGGEVAVLDSDALSGAELDAESALGGSSNATFEYATGYASDGVATRSRLNAYGVRVGIETRIPLVGGLGVYGKGAGALSAGRVKSTLYDADWETLNEHKKTYLTPMVDAGLGLSWRFEGLEARAGYEFNGWYNSGYVSGKKTDFLAHGVVAGLGYNY